MTGCAPKPVVVTESPVALYIEQYNTKYNETLIALAQSKLESQGVLFVTVGQEYMVVIPSDHVYYPSSPRIMWGSYGLLNDVADYLRYFKKVSVKITAYSTGKDSFSHNELLSLARARNIANYLWSQEIDARILSVEGFNGQPAYVVPCGCTHPKMFKEWVEISFRNVLL